MKTIKTLLLLCALAAAPGCGDDPPTGPSEPITDLTLARVELFRGTISPGGAAFYSFNVLAARGVAMMYASLTDESGNPLDTPMVLGFGVPQGTGCGVTRTITVSPALQAQLFNGTPIGTYCVNLADAGGLTAPAAFTIRIRQEPSPEADAAPGSATFASQVAPGGGTTRTFFASRPGNAELMVESVSPDAALLGLGIGLPRVDGTGCVPTRIVDISSSVRPTLTVPVDIGQFCAQVIDRGGFASPASFSVRIIHP
jgi:hypothetical protein